MKIVRLHENSAEKLHKEAVSVFLNRRVVGCGVAQFPPLTRAHEGERHLHEHDEVFIILGGEITVPVEGGPSGVARAGDWVLVEAGEEHHLTNHTHLPCTALYLILADTASG
ncbi:MAG: cupin domain-containing protein [Armatimonadota bacterium]